MFGTDHIYNCDTFNEMAPSSGDPAYLKQIGESIFSAMTAVDPSAIW
jgi:alpha-N-acetylglucosaminidase